MDRTMSPVSHPGRLLKRELEVRSLSATVPSPLGGSGHDTFVGARLTTPIFRTAEPGWLRSEGPKSAQKRKLSCSQPLGGEG